MKIAKIINSPLIFPIVFFIFLILAGSTLLHFSGKNVIAPLSWTDSIFTATSAACVTGLVVVDTGSYFTTFGKVVILCLIQIGGLGIMTFTSLSIYLWRRRTTITDRIAVGQMLLHDSRFKLGEFLIQIVSWTFILEAVGAVLLYLMSPLAFSPFSAFFHAVSAFCNAGFSLFANSLMGWNGHWGVNLVIMALIFIGGIGFSVFVEFKDALSRLIRLRRWESPRIKISWHAKIVLRSSVFLIVAGALAIYIAEFIGYDRVRMFDEAFLTALFQSVTARTAGFNTLDIGHMTNVSLLILLYLMFIGGAPGSCAGGVKVTTFRVLIASIWSQLTGKKQTVIGKFAVSETSIKKALVLFLLASFIIFLAVLTLDFTEGGDKPHVLVRGQFLELLFESVSAFCTVGLSTGLTATLSTAGKWVLIVLMFIGRLGPFVLIGALQSFQGVQLYDLPEESVMIG